MAALIGLFVGPSRAISSGTNGAPRWAASPASSPVSGFPRGARAGRRNGSAIATGAPACAAPAQRARTGRDTESGAAWRGWRSSNGGWRASSIARRSAWRPRQQARPQASAAVETKTPEQRGPTAAAIDTGAPAWSATGEVTPGVARVRGRGNAGCRRAVTAPVPPPPARANRLWAWFTGGNALTRIGVVILFFGVAFLLKYFAEHFTVPIELRLAAVAGGGFALAALGLRLAASRPGYGLSLQGAGAGILYLTTYAAFRLYGVLPEAPAVVLLIAVSALTVGLAVRNDSQPLAGLAIAGGFLAPVLVGNDGGPAAAVRLFRAAERRDLRARVVEGVARAQRGRLRLHVRAGRALGPRVLRRRSITRSCSRSWRCSSSSTSRSRSSTRGAGRRRPGSGGRPAGVRRPAGRVRAAGGARARVRIRRRMERAGAGDRLCAALPGLCARRGEPGFPLLSRAFLALAVIFATIAIPFALDNRWTAALWAVEAAGVYWIGVRQNARFARAFALVVEIGAGVVFVAVRRRRDRRPAVRQRVLRRRVADRGVGSRDRAGSPTARAARITAGERESRSAVVRLGRPVVARRRRRRARPAVAARGPRARRARVGGRGRRAGARAGASAVLAPARGGRHRAAARDGRRRAAAISTWPARRWITMAGSSGRARGSCIGGHCARPRRCGRSRPMPSRGATDRGHDAAVGARGVGGRPGRPARMGSERVDRAVHRALHGLDALRGRAAGDRLSLAGRPVSRQCTLAAVGPPAGLCGSGGACRWRACWPSWFFAVNVLSPGDASPLPYLPLVNPLDLTLALALWSRGRMDGEVRRDIGARAVALDRRRGCSSR